jgi:Ni/Co efflux regulator RcnB
MRKIIIASLAAAAVLAPAAANAQSAREVRHDQREIRKDIRKGDYREAREDRQELREDWRDYRKSHRNVYKRPAYVGPRGYAYRPVNVGYTFRPEYYSSRYTVNDWASYRLPRPAAGLRYIRYGNDVLLINRGGRVVRVYSGFFW